MPKRSRGGSEDSDKGNRGDTRRRRVRTSQPLEMSNEEVAERERRRARFLVSRGNSKEPSEASKPTETGRGDDGQEDDESQEDDGSQTEDDRQSEDNQVEAGTSAEGTNHRERKPWEKLAIGSVGENLSYIEHKNREIEQQRFIVRHHQRNSPREVPHNQEILDRLIEERNAMEDNEENNMPEDQREKPERITRRLEVLRWSLDESQCEEESVNIRAAIQGYETGEIPYSTNFTLFYAGHMVDSCETYGSFTRDRGDRLDRYAEKYGPGWLWQEPPLAGPQHCDALALKGICIDRTTHDDRYKTGYYRLDLKFTPRPDKASRWAMPTQKRLTRGNSTRKQDTDGDGSCRLTTLMDSGATFPVILESDLARLKIDERTYPAQGTMDVNVVGGRNKFKFYEMYVSICSEDGDTLVGQGTKAVWPTEPRTLGGFCPVLVQKDPRGSVIHTHRLSGLLPFDACYVSSAPGMARIWLGEDRRDVLGTNRLPAHLRFDTDKKFIFEYPQEFETLRQAARTPERVIFLHEFPGKPDLLFTDSDASGIRGRSELAIGQYQTMDGSGQPSSRQALPKQVVRIEPRKGGIKIVPREDPRPWTKDFIQNKKST